MKKTPTLTITSADLETFSKILFDAKEYYRRLYEIEAYENLQYLTKISEAYLKYFHLDMIRLNAINKAAKGKYTHQYMLSPTDCFYLLSSILPTNNLTYYAKVKTTILEYCIILLKHYGLICENATFKPALPNLTLPKIHTNEFEIL
jgi:hypothetical protein